MSISVEVAMLLPVFMAAGAFLGGLAYDLSLSLRRTIRRR